MDPSRRRQLLPQGSPASLRRRSSFSPPQLPTSATPLASQSAGDGSSGYPPNLLNPLSRSLGRTAGTSGGAGSSSHAQNAFSTPVLESFQFHFEDGPVSDDIGAVRHFIDLNGLCGVTRGPGDDAGAGQVDGRPVDGKSVQIRVLNSSEPAANSGTLVLEQPALPAPFPKAAGPGRSKRPPSGASPRAGGSVKRSRLSICNRPTPGASGSGSSDTSAGPGGAGNSHLSVGSGASPPAAGGGGINGASQGVGGPVSSGPLTMAMGRGGAALFEMAREVKPSEAHMKKIIKDRRLAELALTDPGKVRSLLAGRVYFAKREKDKANRRQELEKMVETLTKRISTLSDTLSEEQSKFLQIRTENSELMTKLRSMEGMSQLTKARQTALISEVSVRKAKYDAMRSHKLNTSCQERKR